VAQQVSRGRTVPATVAGVGAWANATSAALCDGVPGTFDTATCTWTSAGASDVGSVTIGGYVFGFDGGEQITACSILVNFFVSATLHITSVTAQLQTSAGAAIGAAQSCTLNAAATSVVVAPSVLPTVAQCISGLQVLITCNNSTGTTSRVFSFDNVDITMTFNALPTNINCAPIIRSSRW
jgi:hypothetical protein